MRRYRFFRVLDTIPIIDQHKREGETGSIMPDEIGFSNLLSSLLITLVLPRCS